MATIHKGWRTITVDDATYRWTIRRKAKYWDNYSYNSMQFMVESAAGALLVVELNRPRLDYWLSPERKGELIPVTPREVAQKIREALHNGWNPQVKTLPFLFKAVP